MLEIIEEEDGAASLVNVGSLMVAIVCVHAKRRDIRICSDGDDRITPLINASIDQTRGGTYELTPRLGAIVQRLVAMTTSSVHSSSDLAITALMLVFSRFYAANQYALFVNTFRCLPELERFERFVNEYGRSTVRLPVNLATDERHGLLEIAPRLRAPTYANAILRLRDFDGLVGMMRVPGIRANQFVEEMLKLGLHARIIESFYMFTSITRESRVVLECRELSVRQRLLGFKFSRAVAAADATAATFWFAVPRGAIWFAYHEGRWTYQAYASRDIDALLERAMRPLRDINGIVIGYVHEGKLYPLQLDGPVWSGRWLETHSQLMARSLNSPHRSLPIVTATAAAAKKTTPTTIFFVREGVSTIFRLVK